MRIGILTFCNANNYGAVLQAFSLEKKIQALFGQAQLIDYRCPAIEAMHKKRPVFGTGNIKKSVYNFLYNFAFFPRKKGFERFRSYMNRSRIYSRDTIHEANNEYDVFISGSDQVFNLSLTKGDRTYFLDFVEAEKKKVAYAASLGAFLSEEKESYQKLLNRFDAISLREKASAQIIKNELGIDAQVIPDPVFLHSKEEWKELLHLKEQTNDKPYILIYSLYESKELYRLAQAVKDQLGYKTVLITKALRPLAKADKIIRDADPIRFAELVMNAEYVVTNSFHGTAFSLIFEKQMSVLKPAAAPERIRM